MNKSISKQFKSSSSIELHVLPESVLTFGNWPLSLSLPPSISQLHDHFHLQHDFSVENSLVSSSAGDNANASSKRRRKWVGRGRTVTSVGVIMHVKQRSPHRILTETHSWVLPNYGYLQLVTTVST